MTLSKLIELLTTIVDSIDQDPFVELESGTLVSEVEWKSEKGIEVVVIS